MIDWLTGILTPSLGTSPGVEVMWMMLLVFYPVYAVVCRRRVAMMTFVAAFSLIFAFKVGGWAAAMVLLKAVADYWMSVWLMHCRSRRSRRAVLALSIVLSVGVLAWFKYGTTAMASVAEIIGANFRFTDLVVPVGISFYTFRSISYMVDIYRGAIIAPRRMLDYVFYLTYFPVLLAGPIVRTAEFFPQVEAERRVSVATLYSGLFLIMKGLLKKAVFADYLAQFCDLVFGNPSGYSGMETLLALLGYSMQIYLDFSGYSDIAIGLSRTLGIELPVNFRSPYKASSLTDFWRRWHISLSSWLRDYVYIPLGGNRRGRWRMRLNLLITMTIGGAWHGASPTFAIWGALHGVALVVQKAVGSIIPKFRFDSCLYAVLTFFVVTLLWLPFRCASLHDALAMLGSIFSDMQPSLMVGFWNERTVWLLVLVVSFILVFMPDKVSMWAERKFVASRWVVKLLLLCLLAQLILEFSAAYVAPFIYAGF